MKKSVLLLTLCMLAATLVQAGPVKRGLNYRIAFSEAKVVEVPEEFMQVLQNEIERQTRAEAAKELRRRTNAEYQARTVAQMRQIIMGITGVKTAQEAENKLRSQLLSERDGMDLLVAFVTLFPNESGMLKTLNHEMFNAPVWKLLLSEWLLCQSVGEEDVPQAVLKRLKQKNSPLENEVKELLKDPLFKRYNNIYLVMLHYALTEQMNQAE